MRSSSERHQKLEMTEPDARVAQLFGHFRAGLDLLEEISLRPHPSPQAGSGHEEERPIGPMPSQVPVEFKKLAYTIYEVGRLVSISRSTIYTLIKDEKLRAVKLGCKTLILEKGLLAWMDTWPSR